MLGVPTLERLLWGLSLLAYAVLILRMVHAGIHRTYAYFFAYLLIELARSLAVFPLDPNTNTYAWIWLCTQPVIWLFYILVVLELYSLVLEKHKGIATLSRWALLGALVISTGLSALSLLPDLSNSAERYPVLLYYMVIERGLVSSLAVFLVLVTSFLVWFPVPLSRNVTLHTVVFFAYFLSSTLALFVRNVAGYEITRATSTILLGISLVCLVVWSLFLSRKGEKITVVLRHHWGAQDEKLLLEQLRAINSTLLKTSHK